jgi:hypothetical protein
VNPELLEKINTALDANNGQILWSEFVPTLTPREIHVLHDTLRATKKAGIAKRKLLKVDGKQTLFIVRMSPDPSPTPAPPPSNNTGGN